ncbi:MAG: 23S rRNA (uracil(1939)-C(5))-methyltransferase RlmD [Bacilli bacterium]|nr:23S rRNA (uracil(1939)-C(5))-methyltransferase RlmD [Bacilli bacterium]
MKIVKLDNQGRGITYQDGKIIFVENALENEEVSITITQDKKNYAFGIATEIKEENKNRVIPKCPYYQKCGGCNLMHINCAYEEEYKVTKVGEILKKYADIDADIRLIKNDRELFYRNKITLKIENNKFGYYNANTHKFIEVESCLIASSSINKIINNHDFLEIKNGEIVIRSNYQDDILISINTDEEYLLKDNIPSNIKGIVINDKTIYKNNYFYDYIGELKFKISYNAFFQVNNYMAKQIFDILNNHLSGKNLLDLYCGVGTLGLSLKDKYKNIYGIEKIGNAIKDAKYNAHNNAIENAHYYTGDTSKILKKINTKFDTIIVDPPRSGLNKETIDQIIKIKPQQLAYISCNPLTLARDLKILKEFFSIEKINALDMFPNTHHVECICILNRK